MVHGKILTSCTLCFFLFIVTGDPCRAEISKIAPERDIQVETPIPTDNKPAWKDLWDLAREMARAGKMKEAYQAYSGLLKEKPNIVEARWEFSKLLMQLREWEKASRFISSLIELEPNNNEYLAAGGTIALENGHYSKAVKYFGQVYEEIPASDLAEEALSGLIRAFLSLGKRKGAFLLLEQYYLRNGEEKDVLKRLATLSEELGMHMKARRYYVLLADAYPRNKKYLAKAAETNYAQGHEKEAAKYWQKYLEIDPNYLPFHSSLAEYYLKNDDPESALIHLKKLYTQDYLSASLALRIAGIYDRRLKRPDKALFYYEQYTNVFPDARQVARRIEDIQQKLAEEYLPIVENDGEKSLWHDLEMVTQNKVAIFKQMADIFEKQGKKDQEIAVLHLLREEGAAEPEQLHRLATLYRLNGNITEAYALLVQLSDLQLDDKSYLIEKAQIEQILGDEQKALATYLQYLGYAAGNEHAEKQALYLAGELGLPEKIEQVWRHVPETLKNSIKGIEVTLEYGAALRKNALFSEVIPLYDQLLQLPGLSDANRATISFHKADTLLAREHIFEAEQVVRQVLAKGWATENALEKLIEFSLLEKRNVQARSWLSVLSRLQGVADPEKQGEKTPDNIVFLTADILFAEQQYSQVVELLLDHTDVSKSGQNSQEGRKAQIYLSRAYYLGEDYKKCLQTLEDTSSKDGKSDEMYVLFQLLKRKGLAVSNEANYQKTASFSSRLARAEYFSRYGDPQTALALLEHALELLPQSIHAKIQKLRLLSNHSHYEQALAVVEALPPHIQNQEYFEKIRLRLEFQSGRFEEIVDKVEIAEQHEPQPEKLAPVAEEKTSENMYFWKKLLLARALWAANREEEAIKVYDSLLAVPVDTAFLQKMEVEKINFHLPPLKKSFWNVLPFSGEEKENPMATVMDPTFVAQNIGQPVDEIAASMYGKYRWQKLVEQELSARKAIQERDYHRAKKEYLALMEEDRSQESLFDLATIYDKLGLYGKAAEIYEKMKEEGPLYPGLDEYIEANVLKRQPRIATSFEDLNKYGRDNYINLKKRTAGLEGWLMPSYDQEISLSYFRNSYASKDRSLRAWSDRIVGTYATYFENTIDLNMSFGVDIPTDDGTVEALYKFELITRMNRSLEMYGRFDQELVEDNIHSVLESIISRDFETGMKYDLFPRWFVGADYRFRMYSDDNKQHRYKLWTMYHLFGEVSQFKLKYSYENIRNNDENVGTTDYSLRRLAGEEDRLYWSPESYWQHLFTIHFQHYFDTKSEIEGPLSYFSIDYSYGYEENNRESHEFDLNIFLEINRHFLLKGNLNNENGDDYEETQAAFSLIYRW